jgi:hypothetical protein
MVVVVGQRVEASLIDYFKQAMIKYRTKSADATFKTENKIAALSKSKSPFTFKSFPPYGFSLI